MSGDLIDRGGRGGVPWWCVLADVDAAAPVAALLAAEASTVLLHESGRPWLFGRATAGMVRVMVVGPVRVAVIGRCLASDAELRARVERAAQRDDYDALTALRGSYHLVVTAPGRMLVFGDVAGFRRVFTADSGGVTVVSSHADVLRRLVSARVSRAWLALRLASPEMPSPLRESLTPFEGVRAIPAGHRVTVRQGVVRHAPYWAPPQAVKALADGAADLADALVRCVSDDVAGPGGPVSVQLSGGLDSTAVSCLAADALDDRSTLLLVTAASVSPGNDDRMWARRVAEHLAPAEHRVLDATGMPRFFDDLPAAPRGMDEPAPFTAASARVRHLADLLAARGVRVHFNGQGGDEVLLAPLAYLRDALRSRPGRGWRHLRGQAALRGLRLPRLAWSVLAMPSYSRWLSRAARGLWAEFPAEADALGWEAQPLLPPWASRDAEQLAHAAILAAPPAALAALAALADRGTHAALVRIRSTAYRAALYRDAMASHGVPAAFPFLDRTVLEAALAVHAWERTDPWQPKPLLRAALDDTVPAALLARRTKAHYNDDIYRGWAANRQRVAGLFDDSRLAELGLIDARVLDRCCSSFGPSGLAPAFITDTIACETWLRSLADPFTLPREVNNAHRPQYPRVPGGGSVDYPGGGRPDAAR